MTVTNSGLSASMLAALFLGVSMADSVTDAATEAQQPANQEKGQDEAEHLGYWPQWRGPRRDNVSTETGLLREWPEGGPPLVWRVEGLGESVASVSIADGRIYTVGYLGDSEYTVALDQRTGQLQWAARIGPAVEENPLMRWLSQRSPTVDDERVYVMRADGDLICLRTADGTEVWRKSYPRDFNAARPYWGFCDYPLVDEERLICTPGASDAGLASLDKLTGDLVWKAKIPDLKRPVYGAIVALEAAGVRQYVTFSDAGVVGVAAADGEVIWQYRKANITHAALHTPVALGDRILVPNGFGRSLALLQLSGGPVNFQIEERYHRGDLLLDPFQDNVVVVGDYVYTTPFRCEPMCLALESGQTIWGGERLADRESARLRTALTYADGCLITRQSDGRMRLIEATPDEYREKGAFTIPDHQPAAGATFPVVAGGRLYLRDDTRLFCYDLRRNADPSQKPQPHSITLAIGQKSASDVSDNDRPRSVFVATPGDVVRRMLELAQVDKQTLVYDLGSGDGRIVIAAAKDYGCRAVGYEIDQDLVTLSRDQAAKAGVAELVRIEEGDLFAADLEQADVVAVYLLPKQLEALLPKFQRLKSGARIVSHQFQIPGVPPDKTVELRSGEDGEDHVIHLWTAPLTISN